jgi:hypothetical protein
MRRPSPSGNGLAGTTAKSLFRSSRRIYLLSADADDVFVQPEEPSTDEWWENWYKRRHLHREHGGVREVLRENWFASALTLVFLCVFFVGPYSSDPGGLGIRLLFAIPLGVVTGVTVWWLLMLGYASGWVEDGE